MNRQRLILVGVLGLGLGGLGFDRLVLQSGASGPADVDASATQNVTSPAAVEGTSPGLVESVGSLAEMMQLVGKLNRAAETKDTDGPSRNPFAIAGVEGLLGSSIGSASTPEQQARDFGSRHRLRAVLRDQTGGRIMVGQQTLRLGDRLEGFELVAIESQSAIFEGLGYRVRIGY